jgi:hypothetical protein
MHENVPILLVAAGGMLCLGGWVLFWFGSRLIGTVLGMGFGFGFGQVLSLVMGLDADTAVLVSLGCAALGALGGLVLARTASTLLFAVTGFLVGALLGRIAVQIYFVVQDDPFRFTSLAIAAILGCAVLVALLAMWMQRSIVIIVTSYVGATLFAVGWEIVPSRLPWFLLSVFAVSVIWQTILVTRLIHTRQPARTGGGDAA